MSDKKVKTYIGKRGYTIFTKDLTSEDKIIIENELTFTPNSMDGYGDKPTPFPVFAYSKSGDKMFIPKYYGIQKFGEPQENKINKHIKSINVTFKGELRPKQVEPVKVCLDSVKNNGGGGILALSCASGKTVMSLYLISKLKVKTLVIVSKEFLAEQWKERIEQFLPDASVGILRSKKMEIDNDIVIGMLQSVSMRDYPLEIYDTFGMVIYDEVHCVPSRIFSKALRRIQTKYHFGLSATPNRRDGMTKVTKMYIGPIIYKINKRKMIKNPKNAEVIRVQFKNLPKNNFYREKKNFRGKPDIVKMITNICKCPKRISLISSIIRFLIINDKRHVLVLSERVQYVKDIHQRVTEELDKNKQTFDIGYYIGETKPKERKISEKADLILATYSMAKEAMDIPILDTLIMVSSKGNVAVLEQCVGRVMRRESYPDNRPPLIIDIVDEFSSFSNQAWRRRDFYRKNQYPIQEIIFDEEKDKLSEKLSYCVDNLGATEVDIIDDISEDLDISDSVPESLNESNISGDTLDVIFDNL
jgi:superfamily II DNA or RNA helicase